MRSVWSSFIWQGHFVLSSRVLPLSGETGLPPSISKRLRYNRFDSRSTLKVSPDYAGERQA